MAYQFDWTAQSIKTCLSRYDRFICADMKNGLGADPMVKALQVDASRNLYATNVSDDRYLVIWQLDREKNTVLVKFAIAKQYRGETPVELQDKIEKILAVESNGRMSLSEVKPLHKPEQPHKAAVHTGRPLTPMRPLRFGRKATGARP